MLKFANKSTIDNKEYLCIISMESVLGGVSVYLSVEEVDGKCANEESIILTPSDAACFVYDLTSSGGVACAPVGHSVKGSGADLWISKIIKGTEVSLWSLGRPADSIIRAGSVMMAAPAFIVNAMKEAVLRMMAELMYPTTGELEEEFC